MRVSPFLNEIFLFDNFMFVWGILHTQPSCPLICETHIPNKPSPTLMPFFKTH